MITNRANEESDARVGYQSTQAHKVAKVHVGRSLIKITTRLYDGIGLTPIAGIERSH